MSFKITRILKPVLGTTIVLFSSLGLSAEAPAVKTTVPILVVQGISATATIKTYPEWKAEKLKASQGQLNLAKARLEEAKKTAKDDKDPRVAEALRNVTQSEWDMDASSDLSVVDYISLYLSSLAGSPKLREAAAKMTAEDTLKLLEAYLRAVHPAAQAESRSSYLPRHSQTDDSDD